MIFLGIGSNLPSTFGDRFQNIDLAISYLNENKITVLKKSSYYETPSYPDKKNPKFINVIISVDTTLNHQELVDVILKTEIYLERTRDQKNDPRTCDIDIIDYNGKIFNFEYKKLKFLLPHIKATKRNFVLYPLKEISPQWKDPASKKLIVDLIEELDDEDKKSILMIKKF